MSSCCPSKQNTNEAPSCHSTKKKKIDWLYWSGIAIVVPMYVLGQIFNLHHINDQLGHFSHKIIMLTHKMAPGFILALMFVGLMQKVPREVIIKMLGQKPGVTGLFRATLAGVLLDLCNHGILLVGMDLYKKGARLGQVMAFLIASPWNSVSLTIVLIALIGIKWTLAFILLSAVVAIISGWFFDLFVDKGVLPQNPNTKEVNIAEVSIRREIKTLLDNGLFKFRGISEMFLDGAKESKILLKWLLIGMVLSGLIDAFMTTENFQNYFGASLLGLTLTVLAATIIEVCSEGSAPIGADLLVKGNAPGNSFTFLMAGVSTDYTEILVIKETMKSWKIAFFLPLITLPQIILIGWLLNQ